MDKYFGKKIKEIRLRNHLTQKEFALTLGYKDKSMITHIEKGDNEMTYQKIQLLIDKFNVSPQELFFTKVDENQGYVQRIRKYLGSQKIILNCAGGVVVKDNKILLQRRSDNNKWGLVGGLLEINETYLEGAIREIKEETGLDVEPQYFLGIFHNHKMVWSNGDRAHTIGAYYVFNITSGELRIDEESLELKFFAPDELPYLFAEDHQEAIKAYLNGVKLPLPKENKI